MVLTVRRSTALALAGAVLLGAGTCALGVALATSSAAPQPTRSAAGTLESGQSAPAMGGSQPIGLDIPAIDVHTTVADVGLNPDGSIEVPQPGPNYDTAAWYRYSPTPGEPGPAVIEGHLDTEQGRSVFYRLGALRPGNEVEVSRADGRRAIFRVTAVREYAKAEFPTAQVYGDLDHPGLRLITCGGDIDPVTHHYQDDTVVFADLIDAPGAPA